MPNLLLLNVIVKCYCHEYKIYSQAADVAALFPEDRLYGIFPDACMCFGRYGLLLVRGLRTGILLLAVFFVVVGNLQYAVGQDGIEYNRSSVPCFHNLFQGKGRGRNGYEFGFYLRAEQLWLLYVIIFKLRVIIGNGRVPDERDNRSGEDANGRGYQSANGKEVRG